MTVIISTGLCSPIRAEQCGLMISVVQVWMDGRAALIVRRIFGVRGFDSSGGNNRDETLRSQTLPLSIMSPLTNRQIIQEANRNALTPLRFL